MCVYAVLVRPLFRCQAGDDRKGVQTMIKAAMRILERKPMVATTRLLLTEGDAEDEGRMGEEEQDEREDA
jgi:hypothetical protein